MIPTRTVITMDIITTVIAAMSTAVSIIVRETDLLSGSCYFLLIYYFRFLVASTRQAYASGRCLRT